MKVMFVNMSLDGHHLDYINALCRIDGIDPVVVLDKKTDKISARQIAIEDCVFGSMKLNEHLKWIRRVEKVVKTEKPDVIHFVWGDSFYRFFGLGFWKLCKKYKCCVTFHQIRKSTAHQISIKLYSKIFDSIVVHTCSLKSYLDKRGIKNVVHIEYPNFRKNVTITSNEARKRLGVQTEAPVLLSLGGTRVDKGLDILLDALGQVKEPFYLLIAGAEQGINRETIEEKIKAYKGQVKMVLRYLSIEEVDLCLIAADYIVLPYRKAFDGASGPLAEGVGYGKCIVGANHGSLGKLIEEHHIGYTFESEDCTSLAEVLTQALKKEFEYDEYAKDYRESLTVDNFQKSYFNVYLESEKTKW